MLRCIMILYLYFYFGTGFLNAQANHSNTNAETHWIVSAAAPPEINLLPFPTSIIIVPLYNIEDFNIERDVKFALVRQCVDTFLMELCKSLKDLYPATSCTLVNEALQELDTLAMRLFCNQYPAELYFGVDQFRPSVVREEVKVDFDSESFLQTAEYYLEAEGKLRIFTSGGFLKEYPFSVKRYLKSRRVLLAPLSAGPSFVKNSKEAIEISRDAAKHLSGKLKADTARYILLKPGGKEFTTFFRMMREERYEDAIVEAEELTNSKKSNVKGKAYYLIAMLYHLQGNFEKAAEMASEAKKFIKKKVVANYHAFLSRYTRENAFFWK